MDTVAWILGILLLVLLIQHFGIIATSLSLLFSRLQPPNCYPIEKDNLPKQELDFYQPAEHQLLQLGFEFKGCLSANSLLCSMPDAIHEILYYHPQTHTIAGIYGQYFPGAATSLQTVFINHLDDGRSLYTYDCTKHTMVDLPNTINIQDGYYGNINQQWELHCQTMDAHVPGWNQHPIEHQDSTKFETLLQRCSHFYDELLQNLIKTNRVINPFKDWLLFHPLYAFLYAKQLVNGQKHCQEKLATRTPDPMPAHNAAYLLERQLSFSRSSSTLGKLFAFIATGIVFYISFGFAFSWAIVPTVVAVLIIHELGHYLAMRAFNYQNPRIFFVPFLGAATTGKRTNAKLWQEVVMYLAGPIPGIVLAFVILFTPLQTQFPWLASFAYVSFLLNVLNLLPIAPLDGGKIIERIFFHRFPFAQVIFSGISAALFFSAAWYLENIYIGILGGILCLVLPHQWSGFLLIRNFKKSHIKNTEDSSEQPQFNASINTNPSSSSTHSAQQKILHWIVNNESNLIKRYQQAQQLTEHYAFPPASFRIIISTAIMYFSVMAGCVYGTYQYMYHWYSDDYYTASYWQERITLAQTPAEQLAIQVQAVDTFLYEDDMNTASHFYQQANETAKTVTPPNIHLAKLRLLKPKYTQIPLTDGDITYIEDNIFSDTTTSRYEMVNSLSELVSVNSMMDNTERITLLKKAINLPIQPDDETYTESDLHFKLAKLYEEDNNSEEAEHYYTQGFSYEQSEDSGIYTDKNFEALANLYFLQGRYTDGIALVDKRLEAINNYKKSQETIEGMEAYSTYISQTTIKPLQIKAWLSYLNGWESDAINITQKALQLHVKNTHAEQASLKDYSQKYLELMLDAITFKRATGDSATLLMDDFLGQPDANLKKFAKHCDCKIRKPLNARRYESYIALLQEMGIKE